MEYKKGDRVVRIDADHLGDTATIVGVRQRGYNSITYDVIENPPSNAPSYWSDRYFKKLTKLEEVLK
jgi:hypothetical protein